MDDADIRRARIEDVDFLLPLNNRASEGIAEHIWAQMAAPG